MMLPRQCWVNIKNVVLLLTLCLPRVTIGADRLLTDNPGLAAWFEREVEQIEQQSSLLNYQSIDEWEAAKPALRGQLYDMLGLNPLPDRTPLQAEITGISEEAEFRVERIQFQSMPGLYVSGNLYVPKNIAQSLPAVLYVCGHGNVKIDGISYGSKVSYQRHGGWFARNGYVCLVIDTLQLGEIEGIHHGTYRYDRWWWNARGYTPAGVEAWNSIRALDFLQSRSEVDGSRLGVTGRSGGGAYSWWLAALDERIQCAVPVAGITSLRDHVVNGCVEGHCDCMFMVNAARWDYATVAALVAPRPLLISNTDKDSIFPLEGVIDIHRQVRHIYQLYDKPGQLGLHITEGPHKDTQELHIHAFRWMNRFLRHDESMIDTLAVDFFQPEQLKVFDSLPADERNTQIDKSFVAPAQNSGPKDRTWALKQTAEWFDNRVEHLTQSSLQAWPDGDPAAHTAEATCQPLNVSVPVPQAKVSRFHLESQPLVPINIDLIHHVDSSPASMTSLTVIAGDADLWTAWQQWTDNGDGSDRLSADLQSNEQANQAVATNLQVLSDCTQGKITPKHAVAIVWCRGTGPGQWNGDERKQTQIKRRFQLIGTTVDTMRIWDLRAGIGWLQRFPETKPDITLQSTAANSVLCLIAALFETVQQLNLAPVSPVHTNNTAVLNQSRIISADELLGLALVRCPVQVTGMSGQSAFAQQISSDPAWQGFRLNARTE